MTNFKQVLKDPSFKYFVIGLATFLVVTGGGIYLIKNLINNHSDQNISQTEIQKVAVEETGKKETTDKKEEAVAKNDNKKAEVEVKTETEAVQPDQTKQDAQSTQPQKEQLPVVAPEALSKTGSDDIISQLIAIAALIYAALIFTQSKR
ncbi:MAG: hypothetical protein Q3996_02375 [Candidatus Saccharibacteria bacterium]|nr:hypothetical protein [Candidatus Saccharibacteria bacterium]